MNIVTIELSVGPDDSGPIASSYNLSHEFQPRKATVSAGYSADHPPQVNVSGPRITKSGGEHAAARGSYWTIGNYVVADQPQVVQAAVAAWHRAVGAVASDD